MASAEPPASEAVGTAHGFCGVAPWVGGTASEPHIYLTRRIGGPGIGGCHDDAHSKRPDRGKLAPLTTEFVTQFNV